jgi:hypothetical protein
MHVFKTGNKMQEAFVNLINIQPRGEHRIKTLLDFVTYSQSTPGYRLSAPKAQ